MIQPNHEYLQYTYPKLVELINSYITPDGEPAEDALAITTYALERAVVQCSGGMSLNEYNALVEVLTSITKLVPGVQVTIPASFTAARELSELITNYADAHALFLQGKGPRVNALDFVELSTSEIDTAMAMGARMVPGADHDGNVKGEGGVA